MTLEWFEKLEIFWFKGFQIHKSAAQLLYGPVLVFVLVTVHKFIILYRVFHNFMICSTTGGPAETKQNNYQYQWDQIKHTLQISKMHVSGSRSQCTLRKSRCSVGWFGEGTLQGWNTITTIKRHVASSTSWSGLESAAYVRVKRNIQYSKCCNDFSKFSSSLVFQSICNEWFNV